MATRGLIAAPGGTVNAVRGLKATGFASGIACVRAGTGSITGNSTSISACRGLYIGSGMSSIVGDNANTHHWQTGLRKSTTEGNPSQPSLQFDWPGMWRFRWSVQPGSRLIQINVKQAGNYPGQRPTMVVRASAGILATDQTATAASSTGWVVLGPITFTALSAGMLWVELRNNDYSAYGNPCYFDHIVAT